MSSRSLYNSHNLAGGGVEQLVLQRRTASVDNQNFHLQKLPHAVFGGLHKAAEAYIIMLYSYFTRFQANVQDLFALRARCKTRFTANKCPDFAGHGRKIVPMRKLFSLSKSKNRGTRPRFFGICKANSILCALPRGCRASVKRLWRTAAVLSARKL